MWLILINWWNDDVKNEWAEDAKRQKYLSCLRGLWIALHIGINNSEENNSWIALHVKRTAWPPGNVIN